MAGLSTHNGKNMNRKYKGKGGSEFRRTPTCAKRHARMCEYESERASEREREERTRMRKWMWSKMVDWKLEVEAKIPEPGGLPPMFRHSAHKARTPIPPTALVGLTTYARRVVVSVVVRLSAGGGRTKRCKRKCRCLPRFLACSLRRRTRAREKVEIGEEEEGGGSGKIAQQRQTDR